jgi:hypothetical protein
MFFWREGAGVEGRARGIKQLTSSKRMGVRHHEQGTALPSKGIFFLSFFIHYAPAPIYVLCVHSKKGLSVQVKINHTSGSESSVYSWYTGLHDSKQQNTIYYLQSTTYYINYKFYDLHIESNLLYIETILCPTYNLQSSVYSLWIIYYQQSTLCTYNLLHTYKVQSTVRSISIIYRCLAAKSGRLSGAVCAARDKLTFSYKKGRQD